MRFLLFSIVLPIGITVLVGLAVVALPGRTQTVAAARGSMVVVEGSALGQRLGRDVVINESPLVTLGPPRGVLLPRSFRQPARNPPFTTETTFDKRYFITDLGTLGGTQSFAYAVNDFGEVVGLSSTSGDVSSHAFLYSNGRMTDLYPLNSQSLQTVGPTSINNAGQVASGLIVNGVYVPAIFDSRTGGLSIINSLGGVTPYGFNGVGTSINNIGSVVGYSYIDSINRHAFFYSNNETFDIGSFGGYSAALAMNDVGVIVGFASDSLTGVAHAFVHANGVMENIHPTTESYARDINNKNEVVGEFLTADGTAFHAFLYSQGNFTDLGLAGSAETVAFAINDQSQVVGSTWTPNGQWAFLYDRGRLVQLNTLIQQGRGWELLWAFDINNQGQIAGYGLLNGRFRAFLLTPVISRDQCKDDGWRNFGFVNQGQCIRFVNTGK